MTTSRVIVDDEAHQGGTPLNMVSPNMAGVPRSGETTVDISSDGPTLVLTGEFDVRSTMDVRHAVYDRLAACDEDVVVDLTGVTTIDVTALRVLAAATVVASRQGRHLTLRGAGPAVRRMLHLSRLIRAVEVERVGVSA